MSTRTELHIILSALRKSVNKARRTVNIEPQTECQLSADERQLLSDLLFHCATINSNYPAPDLFYLVQKILPANIADALPSPKALDILNKSALEKTLQHSWQTLGQSTFGYIYQFLCQENRRLAQKRVQVGNKSSTQQELIAFTQLYTPSWVVDHLVQQCLSPQWQGKPKAGGTHLTLCAPDNALNSIKRSARDLTVLDPSCGSGQFLLGAYDLLITLYIEEGISRTQAAANILEHNLFGCDIDSIALWVAALSLVVKALPDLASDNSKEQPIDKLPMLNIALAIDTNPPSDNTNNGMGSLERQWETDHILAGQYAAVVGNPPYIGRKLLDRQLKQRLKQYYPHSHQDLATAFIERGLDLLKPAGRLGYIAQASMMYLPTYTELRQHLLKKHTIISIVEAGTKVFPLVAGEKVNSILLVLQHGTNDSYRSIFINLKEHQQKEIQLQRLIGQYNGSEYRLSNKLEDTDTIYQRNQNEFIAQRNSTFNYRCSKGFLHLQSDCENLAHYAQIKQGLATTDNARFIRWWWQVPAHEIGSKWIPYVKGGGSERWYHPIENVVLWENDGQAIKAAVNANYPYLKGKIDWVVKNQDYYLREGLTFSFVNANQLAVRNLPPGCIFDVAGSSIFCDSVETKFLLLAYLNSTFGAFTASMINPTINFQVGDLKQIPIISFNQSAMSELATLAQHCVEWKRFVYSFSATAYGLKLTSEINADLRSDPNKLWNNVQQNLNATNAKILAAETRIDELVLNSVQAMLSNEEYETIKVLCSKELGKRKRTSMPINNESEFAKAIVSSMLYERCGQTITYKSEEDLLYQLGLSPSTHSWFKQVSGKRIKEFIRLEFIAYQMNTLHKSIRISPEFSSDHQFILHPCYEVDARPHDDEKYND